MQTHKLNAKNYTVETWQSQLK